MRLRRILSTRQTKNPRLGLGLAPDWPRIWSGLGRAKNAPLLGYCVWSGARYDDQAAYSLRTRAATDPTTAWYVSNSMLKVPRPEDTDLSVPA